MTDTSIQTTSRPAKNTEQPPQTPFSLAGKKGLVVGIANKQSIAYGCAKVLHDMGAEVAVTYLNEKSEPYVRPIAEELHAPIIMPCNVTEAGELQAVFKQMATQWGKIDFVVHSIAFAPKDDLHGRVTDCSEAGFLQAMSISCHSFIQMAKLAEPLMTEGGSLITVSFYGSQRVVENYNMMGPVKAALESSVRYLASELGDKNIRVHAISPGAMPTRAASGIGGFDDLLKRIAEQAPLHHLVKPEDVGNMVAFLASSAADKLTGLVLPIDGGQHIMA